MAKDLEYYLAQARRIAAHREADAEKEIRKLYKAMLKDLRTFVSEAYVKYAKDDQLTFALLQKAGYDARFLEEIEKHINIATPKAAKELKKLVEETYKMAYDGMVDGVAKVEAGAALDETFEDALAITPEQIKKTVKNPIMDVALEKNRKDIIYDIKQAVAVGLMNGDRYTTMAHRITEKVDGAFYKSVRIARTEAHRVREAGNNDAAVNVDEELQKGDSGFRMVKVWKTMKDERVRPQIRRRGKGGWSTRMGKGANHMRLEGQIVLADESFDLLDGSKADCPGSSGVAGHDINCRCYVSYEMMTDAEYFAKTGKHFPGYKENKMLLSEIEGTPLYDEIANDLEMYVGGGYASVADALNHDKTKLQYIHNSMTEYNRPLYRIEEARFTFSGQGLEKGSTFSFDDDLRSFSRSQEYVTDLLSPFSDMDYEEPVIFETLDKTLHFNMDKFAENYYEHQSESLVGGTFKVVDITEKNIHGKNVKVVKIKQMPEYVEESNVLKSFKVDDYKELDYTEYKELAKKAKFNEGLYWDSAAETVKGDGPKYDFSSREAYERAHKIHEAQSALYGGYTGTTNSYHINEYLREHDVLGDSMLDHSIRAMDNIVGSWKSTKKMTVTRFVTDDYLESTFNGRTLSDVLQNVGSVITEKQFLSTSANEKINVFGDKRNCRLKMYVDEGTVCFPTLNYGESEILFPRGTKYEIMGAEEKDGLIDIIVKVLK